MTREHKDHERDIADLLRGHDWVEPLAAIDLSTVELRARRQARRRTVLATGAAVVAVVGGVIGGNTLLRDGGGGQPAPASSADDVVPWVDKPAANPPVSAASACPANSVKVSLGRSGAWQGHAIQNVDVTNSSGKECAVTASTLAISLIGSLGKAIGVDLATLRSTPAVVPASGTVHLGIGAPASCDSPVIARSLTVEVAGGPAQTLTDAWIPVSCGAPSLVTVNVDSADEPTDSAVKVSLSAPASAPAGATLEFTVTLTNTSSATHAFTACPSYRISLKAAQVSYVYELNCEVSPDLAAGASRTYAMQIDVPASMSGQDELTWSMLGTDSEDSVTLKVS